MENRTEYTPEECEDMLRGFEADLRTLREEACEIVMRVSLAATKEFVGTLPSDSWNGLEIAEMFGQLAERCMKQIRELKHKETTTDGTN